jgi:uncharacterized protein (TIGR02453 family)
VCKNVPCVTEKIIDMGDICMGSFKGFSKETLEFLSGLRENNNKQWFEINREMYETYLLEPLKCLVQDMGFFMKSIDPYFEITPKVDKTIARIYRDTRFSKDKSPYRSNLWITFRRSGRDWKEDPVYYFEIFPDWYRYGMGFYGASKATMDNFRKLIEAKPGEFLKAISFYSDKGEFILEGEKYKRPLRDDLPPKIMEWYQMKNFYITCNRGIDDVLFSPDLINELISGFKALEPLYHYLWKVRE